MQTNPARQGPYPLTHAQEHLWFIEQLNPGEPAYNLPEAFVFKGDLDQEALQSGLDQLVARHEALRACFEAEDGKPRQFILDHARLPLKVVEDPQMVLGGADLQECLRRESVIPFDFGKAPLASATLYRIEPREHVLLLNLHHIISDAWSQGVLIRELLELYGATVQRRGSGLAELPIQYPDFALWQREMIGSPFGARRLEYWRKKFNSPIEPVLPPVDYSRTRRGTSRGETQYHEIPESLVQSLRDLSRKEGTTLFMTLLSGFNALLHRLTGRDQIVVGSPMACRDRPELESLVGFFVHTQPLWSDLRGEPSFTELLSRTREMVLAANANQDVPCELGLQGVQPAGVASGHPLFDVVFGWQGVSPHNWSAPGLEVSRVEVDTATAKFAWTVLVTESANKLHLRSEFSTELFAPESVARWMEQFTKLLESAVCSPGQPISKLCIQSEPELRQVTSEWNCVESAYERGLQIHQVFEERVKADPDAVALSFGGKSLSYGELNLRANRVARWLQSEGVAVGCRVGLCIERSFELLIGMLGILKAGGTYVPLDASYPQERLEFMVRDCAITIVITQSHLSAHLGAAAQKVLCLDEAETVAMDQSGDNLMVQGDATSCAYVMYTSGSTGNPKGVLISHRGVVRLVRSNDYMDFGPGRVFLQLAPTTFDASTFEIWGALLNGARLVIFSPQVPSAERIEAEVKEQGVDTLWLTAGLFHQMVDHHLAGLHGLKYLLAGGDVLSPLHVARAVRELRECQIVNGYGPTENTTFTCCYGIPRNWSADRPVPIGRPIANTYVYVLDQFGEAVPVGVAGELYAGGDGLALGYLNRPGLSAEKFVPDCFAKHSGSRLYRTGDRVRWNADGMLEFLGRADGQVKIRGYRIELGEVENVIAQDRLLEACAVGVRESAFLGRHLVAYLVPRSGSGFQLKQLRAFLAQKLPSYMIPACFIELGALPLTANGKIDRHALAAVDAPSATWAEEIAEPTTELEVIIAEIWKEILGLACVGLNQNFFQLGGHSLLATQVVSRVRKLCRVNLPVQAIFEAPTVAELAELVESTRQKSGPGPEPAFQASGATRAAELLARLDEFSEAELEELLRDPELRSVL